MILLPHMITQSSVNLIEFIGCGASTGLFSSTKKNDSFVNKNLNVSYILVINASFPSKSKTIIFRNARAYLNYIIDYGKVLVTSQMFLTAVASDNAYFVE